MKKILSGKAPTGEPIAVPEIEFDELGLTDEAITFLGQLAAYLSRNDKIKVRIQVPAKNDSSTERQAARDNQEAALIEVLGFGISQKRVKFVTRIASKKEVKSGKKLTTYLIINK